MDFSKSLIEKNEKLLNLFLERIKMFGAFSVNDSDNKLEIYFDKKPELALQLEKDAKNFVWVSYYQADHTPIKARLTSRMTKLIRPIGCQIIPYFKLTFSDTDMDDIDAFWDELVSEGVKVYQKHNNSSIGFFIDDPEEFFFWFLRNDFGRVKVKVVVDDVLQKNVSNRTKEYVYDSSDNYDLVQFIINRYQFLTSKKQKNPKKEEKPTLASIPVEIKKEEPNTPSVLVPLVPLIEPIETNTGSISSFLNLLQDDVFQGDFGTIFDSYEQLGAQEKDIVESDYNQFIERSHIPYLQQQLLDKINEPKVYEKKRFVYFSTHFERKYGDFDQATIYEIIHNLETIAQDKYHDYFSRKLRAEKMINRDFYKFRLNGVDRIAFDFLTEENRSIIRFLDITHHNYDEFDNLNLSLMTFFEFNRQSGIRINLLSSPQRRFVDSPDYPLLFVGVAGSGKTTTSFQKYEAILHHLLSKGETTYKQLVYITFSSELARKIKLQLQGVYHQVNCYSINDFFIELLKDKGSFRDKLITRKDFDDWIPIYVRSPENNRRWNQLGPYAKDVVYTYFRGVFKGGMGKNWSRKKEITKLSKEDFTDTLRKEKFEEETIRDIYTICETYENYLNSKKKITDNDLANEVINQIYPSIDHIIVDEVQDLTELQLQALMSVTKDFKMFFFGDVNQTINPTLFDFGKIELSLRSESQKRGQTKAPVLKRIPEDSVTISYRINPNLISYINYLVYLRKEYIGAQKESFDGSVKAAMVEEAESSEMRWAVRLKQPELVLFALKKAIDIPTIAIITSSEKGKEKLIKLWEKNRFSKTGEDSERLSDRIFTIQQAKGLEWDNVILYNFISLEKDLYHAIFVDRSEKKKTFSRMSFNKLYVAMTRSKGSSLLIEEDLETPVEDILFEGTPKIMEVQDEVSVNLYLKGDSSFEGWKKEAQKLFLNGLYKEADYAFSRCGEDNEAIVTHRRVCQIMMQSPLKDVGEGDLKFLKEHQFYEEAIQIYEHQEKEPHVLLMRLYQNQPLSFKELRNIIEKASLDEADMKVIETSEFYHHLNHELVTIKDKLTHWRKHRK